MITVTIDDEHLERAYHENFGGDESAFVKYLSDQCHANNIEYDENLSYMQADIERAELSGDSGYTLDEAFDMLRKKHSEN